MKILFYIEDLRPGGKERRLVELIKGLSVYSDIEMKIVLMRDVIHYKEILSKNNGIYYTFRKYGLKKDPTVFISFYRIVKRYKPDIIHVWGNLVAIYALPSKLLLKIPMINSQITDAPIKVSNSLLSHRITFPFSDKIIANTYAGLKSYNAPLRKSSVIYNGFDFSRIENLEDKKEIRKKFGIRTKYIVGMVATFSEKKDYKTFIFGANIVLEVERDITFLCVGEGNTSFYEELVPEKNKDKILFLGKQFNIESIMNICDVGVLMTNNDNHGEGISNALLEFLALGRPVIANNGGGNRELISDGNNGFLINSKSPEELSERILFLLQNEGERIRIGGNGRKIVEDTFNLSRMVNEFYESYKKFKE